MQRLVNQIFKKKALEKYQSLFKEEKENERQYGREQYKNLLEDGKQKLAEYRKEYYKIREMSYYIYKKLFSFKKSDLLSTSIFKTV